MFYWTSHTNWIQEQAGDIEIDAGPSWLKDATIHVDNTAVARNAISV